MRQAATPVEENQYSQYINKFNVFHPKKQHSNPKTKSKKVTEPMFEQGCVFERELIKNKEAKNPANVLAMRGTLF